MCDPAKRYSAEQILEHPWIAGDVSDKPLPDTLTQLKRYNARRKLKAAMGAVRATVRVRMLVASIVAARAEAAALDATDTPALEATK